MRSTVPHPGPVTSAVTARLRRVLRVHFDRDHGTPYWLDRATSLGLDPTREVRGLADLHLLGEMVPADLTERPLIDYVPRRFHGDMSGFVIGQTGGLPRP